MLASDISLARGSGEAMLAEATRGFAATIQARDDLAVHVHHLAAGVDPQAGARVVNDGVAHAA